MNPILLFKSKIMTTGSQFIAMVVKSDKPRKENLKCKFTLVFMFILFLGVGQNVFSQCPITTPNNTDGDYIDRVTFGDIDNTTGMDATGYGNYRVQTTDMEAGGSETFNVWVYCYGSIATNKTYVFVDWNGDNDFGDTDESYYLGETYEDNHNYTTTINCPSGTVAGDKIMRVYHAWSASPSSGCTNVTWGEYEEYTISVSVCTPQSTYYSKSTGNLNDLSTWGSNANGTGCPPDNFTTAGVTYIIQNNATPTTSGDWTVSGAGSLVKVGDNSAAITFLAGGNLSFDCDLEITGNATLNLNTRNMTLSGDFIRSAITAGFSQTPNDAPEGSTVTFSGSSQNINVTSNNGITPTDSDITFNHIVISGSDVKLFYYKTNDRKLNINNFTVNSGKVVTLYSNPQ